MKLLLDNLFFIGQVLALAGLAWGAWIVLRESLAGTVFPAHKGAQSGAAVVDHNKRSADRSVVTPARETRRAA